MLKKLRHRLADLLMGDDVAVFAPQRFIDALNANDYLSLPDDVLAAATRRWFAAIGGVTIDSAKKRGVPVSVYMGTASALALAKTAKDANAEAMTMNIAGSVDGGKTEEDFSIVVTRRPHDPKAWPDDAPAVEKVEEGDKITSLTYRIKFPERA